MPNHNRDHYAFLVRECSLYLALDGHTYAAYLYQLPTPKLLLGRTADNFLAPALAALEAVFQQLEDVVVEIYIASREVFFGLRDETLPESVTAAVKAVFSLAEQRSLRLSLRQVNVIQPHVRYDLAWSHLGEAAALSPHSSDQRDIPLIELDE